MNQHLALVSVLTKYDAKQASPYALAINLRALADAEKYPTIREGILECFTHTRQRDAMLRAIGVTPCKCARGGSCELCR